MLRANDLKPLLVRVCHLLAERGYVSAMDGNVSARLPGNLFLTTPTMAHKAFLREEDLIVVDAQGKKVSGPADRQPTSEIFMHLAAYARRPEVNAVVHAHPPTAVAITIAGESLARCVLPEVVLTLGSIPTAPYQTTGTLELASLVGDFFATYDALLLERHGAICVGKDLVDAFGKMEKVEHTAVITWKARTLGRVRELPDGEVEKLRALGRKYALSGQTPPPCEGCQTCAQPGSLQGTSAFAVGRLLPGKPAVHTALDRPNLEQIVAEEVLRALQSSRHPK